MKPSTEFKELAPYSDLKVVDGKVKVDVYWNRHKECFSIRHRGKVIAHTPKCDLEDVEFVVNQKGRERVLAERRKNVHAFVRGYMNVERVDEPVGGWAWNYADVSYQTFRRVLYNPYNYDTFVEWINYTPIKRALGAHFADGYVYAMLEGEYQ